ncbi:hypothetical protein C5E45_16340 [Nocardia nova]|uniref:Uncharacterized protein n=1 Tax=Nocardia nova TaxID=37330 RepID=A0A2S6APR5_9NOCA|nr:hypothetical protein C5E41_14500 [Nocardia nova]PPJ37218.1 hypothetical protein C5E45_16340 [Nocardia nova]
MANVHGLDLQRIVTELELAACLLRDQITTTSNELVVPSFRNVTDFRCHQKLLERFTMGTAGDPKVDG